MRGSVPTGKVYLLLTDFYFFGKPFSHPPGVNP